jgi:uncharacterized BrkB/YihY/UPF0761 family membrane protein
MIIVDGVLQDDGVFVATEVVLMMTMIYFVGVLFLFCIILTRYFQKDPSPSRQIHQQFGLMDDEGIVKW